MTTLEEGKSTDLTRWLLTPLGVWPLVKTKSSATEIFFAIILQILCYFFILFALIPSLFHIGFREKNLSAKIALCGPVGFLLMNIVKYTAIIYHRNDIKKCIEYIETDWKTIQNGEECDIMMKNMLMGRKLTILCGSFIYSGGMCYHTIMPFIMGSPVTTERAINNRPIVFPGYDIAFNPYVTPTYEIIFFSQCLTAFIVYTITTVSCNLAAHFVTHACSQLQIVISKLSYLVENNRRAHDGSMEQKMSNIIYCHVRVLKFTTDVEKILREICLIEIFASTIIICLVEYYCLTTWNESETIGIITYFMLLISLSFNIFIFCYIGEVLKQQCNEAGNSAYMIKWHRLPPNTAVALILIIANAQVPRKITAGGLLDLSLSSFASVMKTSLVYLNLLRTIEA